MRTQEEVNYYFQSFAIKSATELVKIEGILEVHGIQLPNNIIIHKNGIAVAKFLNWWQNKSNYPETYEECCDVLSIEPYYNLVYYTYEHGYTEYAKTNKLCLLQDKLTIFGKLLICRDAYWKIAGEEMGLDRPWEPKFGKTVLFDISFYLYQDNFVLHKGEYSCSDNCLLVFPTAEMRDAFYENFKDLIEQCKELL